jgi:hypothetical protein
MNEKDRLAVFEAQTVNVRKLEQVQTHLTRSINLAFRKGDRSSAEVHTRCLALVFCAWVEANFSKLIHTPHGFTLNEIEQIKRKDGWARSIESAWQKTVELGLMRIKISPKSSYLSNRKQEILRLVQSHVVEPSLIRNKIAHGQWQVALNRENTAVAPDATQTIQNLNVVTLTRWFATHRYLALIVEALIESPNKAFHRDYWSYVTDLKQYLEKTAGWTLENKIDSLLRKPPRKSNSA